jgi:BolA protein
MGMVKNTIEMKLRDAFTPQELKVVDESHLHAGHAGAPEGGESHFFVEIVSDKFIGQSRVNCHRLVNDVLKQELAGPVHALSLKANAPD